MKVQFLYSILLDSLTSFPIYFNLVMAYGNIYSYGTYFSIISANTISNPILMPESLRNYSNSTDISSLRLAAFSSSINLYFSNSASCLSLSTSSGSGYGVSGSSVCSLISSRFLGSS